MAVTLSLFAGAGAQFLDNNGNPLSGGKIYTYQAGTTTPLITYTTNSDNTAHTNPIILDAAGRVPSGGEIWLQLGVGYKFIVKTSTEVLIATYDNIPSSAQPPAANDADSIMYEQGYTVTAGSFVIGKMYRIASVGTTDFTLIGAVNNVLGTHFIATGVGTGTGTAELSQTVETKLQETVSVEDFGASKTASPATNAAAITAAINYALTVNGAQQPHPVINFPNLYNITGYTITINKPTIIGYPDPYYLTFIGTGGGIRKDDSGYIFTGANSVSGFIRCQNMSFKSVRGAGTTVWDCNKLMYIDASFNEYFAVDRVMYQDSDVNAELFQSSRFFNDHIKDGSGYAFLWKRAADIIIENCKFETRDSAIGNVELSPSDSILINQNNTVRIENNLMQGLFLGDGAAIKLGNSWGLVICGNYTENNKKYIDLHSLVKFAHTALTVEDNSFYLSASQKATKAGTYSQSGTTITITSAAHGLNTGDGVYLDFTSGAATDGSFVISNVTTNTFDVTSATSTTTSGNVNAYYAPLIVGNLRTMLTATLRSHTNSFGRNVSDGELYCFVGTGTLNSYGDYGFAQRGFNNKNISFFAGRNSFTTSSGNVVTTSGTSKVYSFTQTETNLLANEVRTITIAFSDNDITNPVLLQNIYQVYPNQISSVSVLGILPTFTTANSGNLLVTIENRTASTIATVVLNIVCMQLAGY